MCFKSSSSTKSHEVTDSSSTPRYGQSDAFNNFMTGYNNQYTPENFAKVQDSATVNPYTTEAAARQQGIQPVLASTMDTTAQMSRDGLTEADIQRYQNPYISNVINPMMDVFNKQNRSALNNIGSKMAAQGAYRNTGKNQAVFDYYGNVLPGQNLQTAQLYKDSYDNATKTALANMNAKLQAAGTTGQLSGAQTSANQAQFNMGDAIRNANIQKETLPFTLYNQGLAGQQTAGNMYGVDQHLVSDKNSTTTNSPSVFDSILKAGTALAGGLSGMPMGLGAGTSVQQGTQANGGWTTETKPASSWWPFRDGGKVPAKAGGGGIGYAGGGSTSPDAFAQKVLEHAAAFSAFKGQQKEKARGGAIGKDVGGGIRPTEGWTDDRFGPDRFAPDVSPWNYSRAEGLPAPLGAMYGPRSDEMAPPLGEQFGPPTPIETGSIGPGANYPLDPSGGGGGYADHQPTPTDYDPTVPASGVPPAATFTPRERTAAPPTVAAWQPPDRIKPGVYTLSGEMAEPGSWRAYGTNLSSLLGQVAGIGDPFSSIAKRHADALARLQDDEKTYADATGLYRGLKTLGAQKQEAEIFNNDETRRLAAANLAETQRLHGSTMALQDVQTRAGEEAIPSKIYAARVKQAEEMGLVPGSDAYLDYVSDGKYSQGKAGKQTEFDKDNEKAASKDLQERQASAINANAKMATIQRAQKIIENPNVYQGALGDWVLTAKKVGLLANMADPTGVAEGELLAKIGNEFALQARDTSNGTGMPGAMSDSDRKFLMATTLGIDKSPAGNRLMAKLALEQEQYKQRLNQEAIRYITAKRSNVGLNEYLADWMQKNNAHSEDTVREGAAIVQKERGLSLDEAAASNAKGLKAEADRASGRKIVTRYQDPNGKVMVLDTKTGRYNPEDPETAQARSRYEGGYGSNDYHQ